jgi:hypothetical protein
MSPKTSRALVRFAAIITTAGIVIMDPLVGLFILVLAGILAAIALACGSKKARIFAILWPRGHLRRLLLIIAAFPMWKYPDAQRQLERHRGRTRAGRQSTTLPRGASLAMRLPLTGSGSNIINTP